MPVTGANLLEPQGPLASSFFPEEDGDAAVTARLDAYLADGYQRVTDWTTANPDAVVDADDAATAWALHRAYTAIHLRLSANPANASLDDQGSRYYLVSQIRTFGEKASEYLQQFEAILESALPSGEGNLVIAPNFVPNKFVW